MKCSKAALIALIFAAALVTTAVAQTAVVPPAPAAANDQSPSADAADVPPAAPGYMDTFVAPDANWGPDNASSRIAGGMFQFRAPPGKTAERYTTGFSGAAVDVQVGIITLSGGPGTSAGLVLWSDGKNDAETLFLIDPMARRFEILGKSGGTATPVEAWTPTPLLNPSNNRIEVVARADQTTFLINGRQAAKIPTTAAPAGSQIGLYAAGSDRAPGNYSFFGMVAYPPPKPATPTSDMPSNSTLTYQALTAAPGKGVGAPLFNGMPMAIGFNPGQTIFSDDFKTLDPAWGPKEANADVENGTLVIHAAANMLVTRYSSKYVLPEVDAAVSITTPVNVLPNASAGLTFWSDTDGSFTYFQIDPSAGTFGIGRSTTSSDKAIVDWTSSASIDTAPGAVNRLEVDAGTDNAIFLINGHPIGQIKPPADVSPASQVGLVAEADKAGPADFAFSDFVAKMPPNKPSFAVASAPATSAGQAIFSDDFQKLDPSWGVPTTNVKATGGQLSFSLPSMHALAILNDKYAYGQADVSADVVVPGTPDQVAYGGLAFWAADDADYTAFGVAPGTGQYFAYQEVAGEGTTPLPLQASAAVNTAPGAVNHLEVAIRAKKAYLIVNGQEVAELDAPPSSGAMLGLYGENDGKDAVTVEASKFLVAAPNGDGLPAGVTVAATPAATTTTTAPSVAPGATIFSDNFKTLDASWGTADSSLYVQNGRLEIHSPAGQESDVINGKYAYTQADIAASAVVENGTASGATSTGIIFWASGPQDMTEFNVDPINDDFSVVTYKDNSATTVLDWRSSSLIAGGIGKTNRIAVGLRTNKALLMINGHVVGEVPAPASPPGALIGLLAAGDKSGSGEVGYSDFSVTAPGEGDVPPGTEAAPAVGPGQTIFSDDFKTLDPSWGVAGDSTGVANGELELRSAANGEVDRINDKYVYGDADISTSMFEVDGRESGPQGGILFWAEDADNYMLFDVDPLSGKFAAFRETDGKNTTLTDWTPSSAIVEGIGKSNRLEVVIEGNKAHLTINGQEVGQLDKPATVPGEMVGLYAGGDKGPGDFDFSDFVVKAPAGTNTPGSSSSSAGSTSTGTSSPAPAATPAATSPAAAASAPTVPAPPSLPPAVASDEAEPQPAVPAPAESQAAPAAVAGPSPGGPEAAPSAQTSASAMCPGAVVFEDDFQNMDAAWGGADQNTFVTPDHAFGLAAAADHINGRLNQSSRYADVDVCVNAFVSINNGPSDLGGLLFWGDGNNDNYSLSITADGRFGVNRFQSGQQPSLVVPWTATGALKLGKSVPNAIGVSLRGDQATIIINGQVVGSFTGDPPPKGGFVGLQMAASAAGPSAWGFYHLVVSSPVSAAQAAVEQSAAQAVTASGGPSSPPAACSGQLLYQDNFETLDPSWGAADQSFYVKNGALMLSAGPALTTSRANGKARYGDFDVCVLAGSPRPPDVAGSGGLIFWASDAQNFYALAVSNGGSYAVLRYAAGDVTAPVPWTKTDALKPGAGIWNALEVKAIGNSAVISINGRALTTVQGAPPANGSLIAFVAAAPKGAATTWAFSRLRLAVPPGSP